MTVYELSPAEVIALADALSTADAAGEKVRVAWAGGLMVKVGEGIWSPPLGKVEEARR